MCLKAVTARLRRDIGGADRRLVKTLTFLLVLIALSVPLYLIPLYPPLLLPLQDTVAAHSHALLLSLGVPAERSGLFIMVTAGEPFALFIGPDCTAWKSMLLLSALMIAVPGAALRRKAAGILIGVPLVYAANVSRIAMVASVGTFAGEEPALLLHDISWQVGLTALVLCAWFCFLFACRREVFPARAGAPARRRSGRKRNGEKKRPTKKTYS
jgi:exosortase/archaeosortase family protein